MTRNAEAAYAIFQISHSFKLQILQASECVSMSVLMNKRAHLACAECIPSQLTAPNRRPVSQLNFEMSPVVYASLRCPGLIWEKTHAVIPREPQNQCCPPQNINLLLRCALPPSSRALPSSFFPILPACPVDVSSLYRILKLFQPASPVSFAAENRDVILADFLRESFAPNGRSFGRSWQKCKKLSCGFRREKRVRVNSRPDDRLWSPGFLPTRRKYCI